MPDYELWPEGWKDDDKNTGNNVQKMLADVHRRETYWDSLGVPCRRATTDMHANGRTRMQPLQRVSLDVADSEDFEENLDTEMITLSREVPAGQLGEPRVYERVGNLPGGVEMISVPKEDVVAFEAQGWRV